MRGLTPNNRVAWPLHDRAAPSDVQVRSAQGPLDLTGVTSFDEALSQGYFALLG